jgi:two-component system, chemotaxis family, response regulator Rcp1
MSHPHAQPPPLRVLLVEDNLGDVVLAQRAIRLADPLVQLQVVSDGVEALQYLRRRPPYEGTRLPSLILLDLNLPRISGLELLAEVKSDEALRHIPVVVLTGSGNEDDVYKAYHSHAATYFIKPGSTTKWRKLAETLVVYWGQLAQVL